MKTFKYILMVIFVIYIIQHIVVTSLNESYENSEAHKNAMHMMDVINKSDSRKSEIIEAANIINSKMPVKIDDQTTAVKAEYLENENKLILYYKVTGFRKEDKTTEEINSIIESLKSSQLVNARENPNNETFVKERVTFEFIYKDLNDSIFCNYQILPSEYIKENSIQ